MGVEAEIGCLSCKKYIWLGSMKPEKWRGFQIPNKDVFRFFSLHSKNQNSNCNLYYTHDLGVETPPWNEDKKWQEDVNSRSFWDSYSENGKICGNCNKRLADKNDKELGDNIKKGTYLWFCNNACFEAYKRDYRIRLDIEIYDSTEDEVIKSNSENLVIGCSHCKSYCLIDNEKDASGIIRDYRYLHEFLIEHAFHRSLMIYIKSNSKKKAPWEEIDTKASWREYEY